MSIRLTRAPDGSLLLAVGGLDRGRVRVLRAAPLSNPHRYISLVDRNGDEIAMIADLASVAVEVRALVNEELDRTYPTTTIERINSARVESGVAYLNVETSGAGSRDLIVRDARDGIRQFGHRLVVSDVDDNVFQIPDVRRLDVRSAKLLKRALLHS